jgi:chorismate synthase
MIKKNVNKNWVRCGDPKIAKAMIKKIEEATQEGDSISSVVEFLALNVPIGLGEPFWDSIEGEMSKYFYAIPGVKGIDWGHPDILSMKGSESKDKLRLKEGKVITERNIAGGVVGGITDGMPIMCRVKFKAPSYGPKEGSTVNLKTMEEVPLPQVDTKGRVDMCIAPRAVPIVEAAGAICLVDHAIRAGLIPSVLKS